MEQGFIKANSSNLPRIDLLMLGGFFALNDFCSSEFRNIKTSTSSRPSYGDDAVSYVQLKRGGKICIVRLEEEVVISVQCHDCVASEGGCKYSIAFLMWIHRWSEEPPCTAVSCYWKKFKLSRVGSSLKYMTAKELSNGAPSLLSNSSVLDKLLDMGRKRKLYNCELLKYQSAYICDTIQSLSMHQLVLKYKEKCSSRAYEFSRCNKNDGTLIALIMGGSIPDTAAMKRGRILENEVRKTVSMELGKKIKKCGLMLSSEYLMIAGSPDGICEDSIIEIKCPTSAKTYQNYVKNGKPTEKFNTQMQMYLTGLQKGYFCVADNNYSTNKKVEIICVTFNETYMHNFLKLIADLWKEKVYPVLYQSTLYVLNNSDIMSSIREMLTKEFFEKYLHPYFENLLSVLSVDSSNVVSEANYTSELLRVRVVYSSEDGGEKVLSVIAKAPLVFDSVIPTDKKVNIYDCEFNIYGELLPEILKIGLERKIAPKGYYSTTFPKPMMVMEDLRPLGYKMVSRYEGLDLDHCFIALEKLAYFHSASLLLYKKNPKLVDKYNVGFFYNNKSVKFLLALLCKDLIKLCETVPSLQRYHKKLISIEDIEEKICATGKPSKKFNVLNHGDFWCNNILFHYEQNGQVDDAVFVDYQVSLFTSPVLDLHHFVTTSLSNNVKSDHMNTILNYYFDKLMLHLNEANIEAFLTREEFFDDFKERAFVALGEMAFSLPLVKAPPRKDATLIKYIAENEEGSFRHDCFNNPKYIKELEQLLSFYENLGIFNV
ncbi:hypothetical protein FQA39_LY02863 [Lamprigera yunnana]|nr:hypothetical protein FQA39_LY02863 [Lamprigera yunnana]